MADTLSTGMNKDEMKSLLKKASASDPMNFAFAADKKQPAVALLLMHKSKDPRACAKLLETEFKDTSFNLRFGTVTIDPSNSKKAIFQVNKSVSGFAKRLTKTLKGTGFNFVEIVLEDGTSVESDSEEEVGVTDAPGAASDPASVVAGEPAATGPGAAPPGGPKPGAPQQDPAALVKDLGDLARQIKTAAGNDAALLAKLMKFATDANVNIKTNNLTYAATAIAQLRTAIAAVGAAKPVEAVAENPAAPNPEDKGSDRIDPALQQEWDALWANAEPLVLAAIRADGAGAGKLRAVRDFVQGKAETGDFVAAKKSLATLLGLIGAAPKVQATTAPPAGPPVTEEPAATAQATEAPTGQGRAKGAAVRLAQAMIVWNDARSHVRGQIKLLQQEIIAQTADEPDADDIKANLGNLEEILENLDDSLTAKLGELRGATDPDKKAALSDQARAAVRKMLDYAKSDDLMNEIDTQNGFVNLSIQSRVTSALAEVLETI